VKFIALLAILMISIESFAWQEEYYDWDSLTFTSHLIELGENANLRVSLSKSAESSKFIVTEIELTVGKNQLKIPPEILKKYKLINPVSFSISASKEAEENSITIYFTYDGEKRGSVSFRNYKYSLHSTTENS
jgi:hypothetical protein